jgi:hypothetical protein
MSENTMPSLNHLSSAIRELWILRNEAQDNRDRLAEELDAAEKCHPSSVYDEVDKRYQKAFDRLWEIDEAIIAAPTDSIDDLIAKGWICEYRHHEGDSAPDDFVKRLFRDVQNITTLIGSAFAAVPTNDGPREQRSIQRCS